MADIFREMLAIPADDGIIFDPDNIVATAARAEDEYSGVRLAFRAKLAGARLPIQVDIGFGDAITPSPRDIDHPSLLDFPSPRLRTYPPETVVAEKFQAIIALGMINTRMKDFFDLWAIANTFAFEGAVPTEAIVATFGRRQTTLPTDPPVALTAAFAEAKQA